jgi:Na+-translocating ferredoxin:NAD+ oxidoreductase subunit B
MVLYLLIKMGNSGHFAGGTPPERRKVMSDEVYRRLATVLDTLPNGFPPTESGVEIKLLKRIFTPEQAELFCNLRLTFETAEQVAQRTGQPLEGLEDKLKAMREAGQLFAVDLGGTWVFRMMPWVVGIYEFQNQRLDKEFVELFEEYGPVFSKVFFSQTPQVMHVLPIEKEIAVEQEALPYEKVSSLIEQNQSFLVNDCICKKEQGLMGHPCDRPLQVCLAMAPIPKAFDEYPYGKVVTKEEAYVLLNKTEELGLVHLTANQQGGNFYICNCCGCCCGVLRSINEHNLPASKVLNSHFYAEIDQGLCASCGICADERCQVKAIEEVDDSYRVDRVKCIGCGLCVSTCTTEAMKLIHKSPEELQPMPKDEMDWLEKRGVERGVDFSAYK